MNEQNNSKVFRKMLAFIRCHNDSVNKISQIHYDENCKCKTQNTHTHAAHLIPKLKRIFWTSQFAASKENPFGFQYQTKQSAWSNINWNLLFVIWITQYVEINMLKWIAFVTKAQCASRPIIKVIHLFAVSFQKYASMHIVKSTVFQHNTQTHSIDCTFGALERNLPLATCHCLCYEFRDFIFIFVSSKPISACGKLQLALINCYRSSREQIDRISKKNHSNETIKLECIDRSENKNSVRQNKSNSKPTNWCWCSSHNLC